MGVATSIIAGAAIVGAGAAAAGAFGANDVKLESGGINGVKLGDQSAFGAAGQSQAQSSLANLGNLRNSAYFGASNDLASLLQSYSQGGFLPTAQDTATAQQFATSQFGAQRVAMNQAFQDQLTQANRQAALSGRGVNDPILRAKLAQEQTRQSASLDAQQNAFAMNYAQQMPQQRLQYAEGRTNVLGQQLSTQMGLEQSIFNNGMNAYNTDFAQRMQQYQTELQKQQSLEQMRMAAASDDRSTWQNIGSTLQGGLAGAGAGMGMAGGFGGGGGGMPMPAAAPMQSNFSGYNYGASPSSFFGLGR